MLRAISNKYILRAIITGGSRAAATSKMEQFVIIVNHWKPLTIITKRSILDVAAAPDLLLIRFLVSRKERWKDIKTEISWFFMTDSHILEKVFRTLIWDFILIIGLFVNRGNRCIFALSGKTPLGILLFIASTNGWESTSAGISNSLGGILSVPVAYLTFIFLRSL